VTPTVPASICLNAEENIPQQLTKLNNFKRFENLDEWILIRFKVKLVTKIMPSNKYYHVF
jgi:hypothetical protein